MPAKLTFEQAQSKLKDKINYLTLISYNGYVKKSVFIDDEFGEFEGVFINVLKQSKRHPQRALQNIRNAANNELTKIKRGCTNLDKYKVICPLQNETILENIKNDNLKTLGVEWYSQSQNSKDRVIMSIQKEHGCDHFFQSDVFKNKSKKTNISKRGVEYASQSEDVKIKAALTSIDNWGFENPAQSPIIQEKIKQTNIKERGVPCTLQDPIVVEKCNVSNLYRWGSIYPMQNEIVRNKAIETNLKEIGVANPFQYEEYKEKGRQTNIKNIGVPHPLQNKNIAKKAVNKKIENGTYHNIEGNSALEYYRLNEDKIDGSYTSFIQNINKFGAESAINHERNNTNIESAIKKFLTDSNIKFKREVFLKTKNKNYRVDFLLEDYNLIIECDGLYWHSEKKINDNNYHKQKREDFLLLGYDSLFFRSDEIETKLNIVKSIISKKINLNINLITVNDCKINLISKQESDDFFNKNHILGPCAGTTYALVHNNIIVLAVCVSENNNNLQISRFATLLNTEVFDGFEKITNYLITLQPNKILSTIDLRFDSETNFIRNGFVEQNNELCFKWTNCREVFSENESGDMYKIWDCGQKTFELALYNDIGALC